MAKSLQTRYGKIKKLGWNPRNIETVAFTNLCESIRRNWKFMVARGIVIDEKNEILGGNQRYTALQTIYEDLKGEVLEENDYSPEEMAVWKTLQSGRIPDEWVVQVTGWTEDEKKRFNLIDNSPEGISGTFDYETMREEFGINIMAESGIDLSNVQDAQGMEDFQKTAQEKVEESEMGEDSDKNKQFLDARQQMRERGEDSGDVAFHLDLVFQSYEQKLDFLKKTGLEALYDMFIDGCEFAKKFNIEVLAAPTHVFSPRKPEEKLKKMALPLPEKDVGGGEDAPKEEKASKPKPKEKGEGK